MGGVREKNGFSQPYLSLDEISATFHLHNRLLSGAEVAYRGHTLLFRTFNSKGALTFSYIPTSLYPHLTLLTTSSISLPPALALHSSLP